MSLSPVSLGQRKRLRVSVGGPAGPAAPTLANGPGVTLASLCRTVDNLDADRRRAGVRNLASPCARTTPLANDPRLVGRVSGDGQPTRDGVVPVGSDAWAALPRGKSLCATEQCLRP